MTVWSTSIPDLTSGHHDSDNGGGRWRGSGSGENEENEDMIKLVRLQSEERG